MARGRRGRDCRGMTTIEQVAAAAVAVYHHTGLPYEIVECAAVLVLELERLDERDLERRLENVARFIQAGP